MTVDTYIWKVQQEGVQEEQACIEELQCLERLQVLSITLEGIPSHSSQDAILSLTNRLKAFQIVIGNFSDEAYERPPVSVGQRHDVIMDGIDLMGGPIGCWLSNATSLWLKECEGLNDMLQNLVIKSVGSFTCLKELVIELPYSSFQTGGRAAAQYDLLPNLEELHLIRMEGIESISELVNHLGLRFQRLKTINVVECWEMKYLLSLGNSTRTMPNLEEIFLWRCPNLEELFNYLPLHEINMAPDPITPKLRNLKLSYLPKLRNLCRDENTWPDIDVQVDVIGCDLLSTEQ